MCTPSVLRRILARSLDDLFLFIFWVPLFLKTLLGSGFRFAASISQREVIALDLKWLVFALACHFGYRILFLKFLGATPGKLLLGLRLISSVKSNPELSWAQVLVRVFADKLSFFFGWGLFSLALCRYDRTHFSDRLAETRVVRICNNGERLSEGAPTRYVFWGLLFFMVLSSSGFSSVGQLLKLCRISDGSLLISVRYFLPY